MGTKSLSIKNEAYRRLKSFKNEGESFSDVIMKVTEDEKDFSKGFGYWGDKDNVKDIIEEGREKLDRDLRERER